MQRIAILGGCGAGKSTLARNLAKITGLPLFHLDQEFMSFHADLVAKQSWIIDGNYSNSASERINRADMLILFDLPTYICLYRVIKRIFLNYGKARPDSADGCTERFDLGFLQYVIKFRRNKMPNMRNIVKQRAKHTELFIVKSSKDLQKIYYHFDMVLKQGNSKNA